jgi:DNA-binding NarL/FixJ family response regulator
VSTTWASAVEPTEVLDFARALGEARTVPEIAELFVDRGGPLLGAPMYGFDLVDPRTRGVATVAAANVSEVFLARYARDARAVDPVRAGSVERGAVTYNRDLMSEREWLESDVFRRAYQLHDVRHVVEAPLAGRTGIIGSLCLAESEPARPFGPERLARAGAFARLLASAIERTREGERLSAARDSADAALALMGTAVVTSIPAEARMELNEAARALVANIVSAEERLHRLLSSPPDPWSSRCVQVELLDGTEAVLHCYGRRVDGSDRSVAVMQLERSGAALPPELVGPLTPREAQVAALIIEGLRDREIAARLTVSSHTVKQYVKQVYRKLGVNSRVALTRLSVRPVEAAEEHRIEITPPSAEPDIRRIRHI